MDRSLFEQIIQERLKESLLRYPAMEQQDAVKYVFQAMLGVGHLLSSRKAVEGYIVREMNGLAPDPTEPLFETLSPSWGRLNLRKALAEQIQPSAIADHMFASRPVMQFSRRDVYDYCMKLAESGDPLFSDTYALRLILDETWLPSHSPVYTELYHPAYRVIAVSRML